ncbi:uncharacterized protein L969DRAFT_85703 [Mixia osmundae IAM 14324]|uniref:N-acetyltransferase domain-containing protein n=1 Tax=Mixia osmundae (strain CBS 9802 / IAM 14324 / JCM 22182 / KY 12970) TaxID=764103 RepID=G7E658_MIXOS|nr:uncharacterized protein L969DRAFT_85703 [Mixia osmundae IAM 14324]KEI40528.1 hypothetical protein L969DRAFT_85703 [Mixia osmundae IAM 14324]GAA98318.1 hypothetical protein E5Q_05003 [Mixia osmundae IAM 14324]
MTLTNAAVQDGAAITISRVVEADLDEFVRVSIDGFSADPLVSAIMMPIGVTPKSKAAWMHYTRALFEGCHLWKAAKPDTGEIVGGLILGTVERDERGKWSGHMPRWADNSNPFWHDPAWLPDFNITLMRQLRERTVPAEESLMKGRRYIKGISLFVLKELQHAGIGRQLCAHALSHAKQQGLPIFCLASPAGLTLYLKLGFEKGETVMLDPAKPQETMTVMLLSPE